MPGPLRAAAHEVPYEDRVWVDAWDIEGERRLVIQPGRPDTEGHDPGRSQVLVINDHDGTVLERGRRMRLRGTWTLRQYRQPTPCGAQYNLTPVASESDAQYQWEVR